MLKEQRVISYYVLCNKLKNVIRSGWKEWNVKRNRIESVAEHIYGTQMLAIAMNSEYSYDIDISKVIFMIAIHELGEIIIGDLTPFQMDKKAKEKIEHEAVHNILKNLVDGDYIEKLFLEFDAHETKESKFAYQCDKLEADIQSKLYDEEHSIDFQKQKNNITLDEQTQKSIFEEESFSNAWIKYDQNNCGYDSNFMKISEYLLNNSLKDFL